MKYSILGIMTLATALQAVANVVNMRCEYLDSPIGVDTTSPRLTWQFDSESALPDTSRLWIELAESDDFAAPRRFKCSEAGRSSVTVPDTPSACYFWRLVEIDRSGHATPKSPVATFETGRFDSSQWTGRWITDGNDRDFGPAPHFRHSFTLDAAPGKARAYISARGYYYLTVNGVRVDDSHMNPGFTAYNLRSLYTVHDISRFLTRGENIIEVTLGNGFANCQSRDAWGQERAPWRDRPAFVCDITADGQVVASTDTTWQTSVSPVLLNNLYSGEHRDGRITDAAAVSGACAATAGDALLKWQSMPPIRPVATFTPRLVKSFGDTIHVYDVGRNIAGVCSVEFTGQPGTRVELTHGELLKSDGRLETGNLDIYYHPLRSEEAFQTDVYTIGSTQPERFQPQFVYHGFRYVELRSSQPIDASGIAISAIQMRTDIERTGHFSCSNELLNRIYDATMLSYEGNLHSIPTDCPQREKNGWTADAHVAIDLGLLNYDGITFYEKWMNDFIDNQLPNGNVSGIVPSAGWGYGDSPGPVWDAALFIVPTAIYDYYGDPAVLRRLYPSMVRYMSWLDSLTADDDTLSCGIGDWLPYNTTTPTDFTTTLYAYADCRMLSRIASVIGSDSTEWSCKAERYRNSINRKWFDSERALYANGSQAALAVALYWGIVPEGHQNAVAAALNNMIVANDYALDFGLLGSKTVLRVLCDYGYADTAYRMATRTAAPSWGHWIDECGYTTLAETWTLSPEFRDASLNHVFFGDIAAWMTTYLAGLRIDRPGFEHFIVKPLFIADLDRACADYRSVKGLIEVGWKRVDDSQIELTVTVPPGCSATVDVGETPRELRGGRHTMRIKV